MKSAKTKPRIVVDTNVWVSALIFGGNAETVARLFVDRAVLVVVSEELLTELKRIVSHKFQPFVSQLAVLEASLRKDAEWVRLGTQTVTISRDPDDNKVIETALVGGCSYLISGDNDLLSIKQFEDITIMNPADFLELLKD